MRMRSRAETALYVQRVLKKRHVCAMMQVTCWLVPSDRIGMIKFIDYGPIKSPYHMRPGVSSRVEGLLLRGWKVYVDGDRLDPRCFANGVVDGMRRGLAILVAVCVLLWASEHADAMRVRRNDGQPVVTPSAVVAAATTAEKQENPLIEDNGETNQDAQRINTMRAQAVNKHAVNEPNAQAKSSTNQTSTQVFASSVVLVGGAVIIAIVAMAFKHTQKINTKRDENNPMQQSLLCHDMDYAAM